MFRVFCRECSIRKISLVPRPDCRKSFHLDRGDVGRMFRRSLSPPIATASKEVRPLATPNSRSAGIIVWPTLSK